jgi:hypothetical protein
VPDLSFYTQGRVTVYQLDPTGGMAR